MLETNWVESVGIVKPYQEVYGRSRCGKTELVKVELRELKKRFPDVQIEGYGSKLSQRDYVGFDINWHESIRARTMLGHSNSIVLLEDLHEIVTKANARTLRKFINGHSRKMGNFVIEVVQSRDFAGYRVPPIAFKIVFEEPFKFWIKFENREEGMYDVSAFDFEKAVKVIIECLFDANRPAERMKRKVGCHSPKDTEMAKCCVEFDKGKRAGQVAKEMGFVSGSKEYNRVMTYFYLYNARKFKVTVKEVCC